MGEPMVGREPTDHTCDCYFCITSPVSKGLSRRKSKEFNILIFHQQLVQYHVENYFLCLRHLRHLHLIQIMKKVSVLQVVMDCRCRINHMFHSVVLRMYTLSLKMNYTTLSGTWNQGIGLGLAVFSDKSKYGLVKCYIKQ